MNRRHVPLLVLLLVVLATWVAMESAAAEEARALPEPGKLRWIEASIRALEENGVAEQVSREYGVEHSDGTRALPVKHVIACETVAACSRVARWARRNGLMPSSPLTEYGHGGVKHYEVHLRQRVPLAGKDIQAEVIRIYQALLRLSGTRYATWMLDIDPEGKRIAR